MTILGNFTWSGACYDGVQPSVWVADMYELDIALEGHCMNVPSPTNCRKSQIAATDKKIIGWLLHAHTLVA